VAKALILPTEIGDKQDRELQEIVKSFRQKPGEGVLSWLVRVWDNAGNTVLLLYYELRQLGVMAQDAQVRAEMSTLGPPAEGQPESPSLYRWLAEAVGAAYPSVGELEALVSPWKTISEGIQALRQLGMAWAVSTGGTEGPDDMLLGMAWAVSTGGTEGPDDMLVSKSTKAAFIRTAPDELKPSLLAVVMAADGRVGDLAATLMQLGTALAGAWPKGEIRVPRRVLWSDLLQAGVPREDIDRQPTVDLYKRWMQLPAAKRSMGPEGEKSVEQSKPAEPSAPPADWQLPRSY
uniref:Uncharacterized protein n=1 Tax=Gopherus agassizii TaxID=38772 RepID=A0A452I8Z8_9SAUR